MKTDFAGKYEIDDSFERLDFDLLEKWLAGTYWSPGIKKEEIFRGTKNSSIAVGCYADGRQVGFLRAASDKTRFAFVMDVYVDDEYRNRGIANAMMMFLLNHPDYSSVYIWTLMTKDAHHVYSQLGFTPLEYQDYWMWIKKPRPAGA